MSSKLSKLWWGSPASRRCVSRLGSGDGEVGLRRGRDIRLPVTDVDHRVALLLEVPQVRLLEAPGERPPRRVGVADGDPVLGDLCLGRVHFDVVVAQQVQGRLDVHVEAAADDDQPDLHGQAVFHELLEAEAHHHVAHDEVLYLLTGGAHQRVLPGVALLYAEIAVQELAFHGAPLIECEHLADRLADVAVGDRIVEVTLY